MEIAKVSTFIRQNNGPLLAEWEAFARTLTRDSSVDIRALREHAATMLDAIAGDIETPQSAAQQADKSKGLETEVRRYGSAAIAAAEYGHGVAGSGFTVLDIVAEFRALRASVTRLWITQSSQFGRDELEGLIRFNEAVDEAIAYSLERYVSDVDETRRRFLAILGHDLRNPLTAVGTAASFLAEVGELAEEPARLVAAIQNAAKRMDRLVADMLELAGGLGNRIPVGRSEVDVGHLVDAVVAEIRTSYPTAIIQVSANGNLSGRWDAARITQALTNLIGNAIQHGDKKEPIQITSLGGDTDVSIEVRNSGPPIPPSRQHHIFEGPEAVEPGNESGPHLGLGLFVVSKIVQEHGGTVEVHSTTDGTIFTIHLPRAAQIGVADQRAAESHSSH